MWCTLKTNQKHKIRPVSVQCVFLECSEEARLEFDGGCSLHGWLSLPGCSFGFVAGLVGPYCRFQPGFKLRCFTNYCLEGSWIEGADPH